MFVRILTGGKWCYLSRLVVWRYFGVLKAMLTLGRGCFMAFLVWCLTMSRTCHYLTELSATLRFIPAVSWRLVLSTNIIASINEGMENSLNKREIFLKNSHYNLGFDHLPLLISFNSFFHSSATLSWRADLAVQFVLYSYDDAPNSSITLLGILNLPRGLYSSSSKPKPLGPPISMPLAVEVHFSEAVMPRTTTGRP